MPGLPSAYDQASAHSKLTQHLPTVSRRKVLGQGSGTSNMLWEALYYDHKGRIVQRYHQHYGGGGTAQTSNYDEYTDATSGNTQSPYQLPGTTSYSYDENGNLLSRSNAAHPGNNITSTAYNILNLPRQVATPSGTISYTYDAAGNKLRSTGAQPGHTRDYIDGIEYTGGTLELIHTEEGRIVKSGSSYLYDYLLKDHLGNNRVGFLEVELPSLPLRLMKAANQFGLKSSDDISTGQARLGSQFRFNVLVYLNFQQTINEIIHKIVNGGR